MRLRFWAAAALIAAAGAACYVYPEDRRSTWDRDDDYDSWRRDGGSSWSWDAADFPFFDSGTAPPPDVKPGPSLCNGGSVIDPMKELMIIHPSVVDDSRWSFHQTIDRMAPPGQGAAMVLAWLEQWKRDVTVTAGWTTTTVPARPTVEAELICPWLKLTPSNACDNECDYCAERKLDMARAPFKLIAIVNRVDLHENETSCRGAGAEARLVFTALRPGTSDPIPFTAIFEYAAPVSSHRELGAWANEWHSLGLLPFGSAYNAKLQALTDRFARGSQLLTVRTNEVAFGNDLVRPWEMREFRLTSGALVHNLLAQTPHGSLNATPELAALIRGKEASIAAGNNALPFEQQSAYALIPSKDFKWSAPGLTDERTRAAFSKNTCNGCHGGDGAPNAIGFQHVAPGIERYAQTRISGFVTKDLARRMDSVKKLLCGFSCGGNGGGYGWAPEASPPFKRVH